MTQTKPDYDETAVDIVCNERKSMKLRGVDLVEAVRRLSAQGLQSGEIEALVQVKQGSVARIRKTHGIERPPTPWGWYSGMLSDTQRRRARERQREYLAARRAQKESPA